MPQTIYGGQVGTATIRAGDAASVSVDAGSGAIVEIRRGDTTVSKTAIAATTTFGPYTDDMGLRVSAFAGATATISDPIDQNASRPTDVKVAAVDSLVSVDGNLASAAVATTTGKPGQIVKLSDGPDKGACLVWSIPEGRTTYAWCWQIYPLAAYL
jgi:hypothetical protein